MSDASSTLRTTRFSGIALIESTGPLGMISLRGTFDDKGFSGAVNKVCGLDIPKPRKITRSESKTLIWMSPDELLLTLPHQDAGAKLVALERELDGIHALVVNVSDARVVFDVSEGHARDVLAKLFPINMSSDAFKLGTIRRSRLAQIPAAVWMEDTDRFRVVCFRSVSQYAFDVLSLAAAPGSEVALHV